MLKKKFALYSVVFAVIIMTLCLCFGMIGKYNAYALGYGDIESVFLGGIPIGISAKSDYYVVTDVVNVIGKDGAYSPAMQAGISKGDIIYSVNGKRIEGIADFNEEIQRSDEVVLSVGRNGVSEYITVNPVFDVSQNSKKVGMLIKNDISGMGTLTFVTKDNKFGALGHIISDEYGYGDIYSYGTIYNCAVSGYNLPTANAPGELRGNVDFSNVKGGFAVNNITGIYGETTISSENFEEIEVADRNSVVAGKAQIVSTIDGTEPKTYDIEIIKAVKQDKTEDKSLVIRITDKELLSQTGGILQGMSGSPIIQNGKLVGAVTHVFTNDSTKGYGIYAEWMIENLYG